MPAEPGSRTLAWAVGLLAAQCVGQVVVTALLAFSDTRGTFDITRQTSHTESASGAVGVTLFAALTAALFGLLAWALWRRRSWARGPGIVLELLLLPIGYSMATNGLPWLGIPVLLTGLAGGSLLLAPSTRAALGLR